MLPSSSHRAPGSCAPPAAAGGSGVEPAAPLLDAVLGFDGAHGPGGRAHHDRFGDHVGGVVAHAAQQVAVGDAGGGEVAVVGGDQIVGGQHALQIVAGVDGLLSFLVVLGGEPALEHAAGGLDGAGGDDALGGAAQPQQHVHAGAAGGGDRAGHVPVHDELDARPGGADLLDQLLVTGALEHAHGDLLDRLVQRLGDQLDVLFDRQAQVHVLRGGRTHHHLLHVEHGRRVVHAAALGDGEHRQRVVVAEGGQPGAVDRIDRDVDVGPGAVTDALAVEQHGGLVLLALADHDGAVHPDGVHEGAHRIDGGPVSLVLVAEPHPATSGDRGGFGHPHQFEGEVAVGGGHLGRFAAVHRGLHRRGVGRWAAGVPAWTDHLTCAFTVAASARGGTGSVVLG